MYFVNGFKSWWSVVRFVTYFFSIDLLIRTLLSGWQRDKAEGFEWWQRLILGGIFLVIGALIRIVVILIGLWFLAVSIILMPFFVLFPVHFKYESLVKSGSIGKSWAYGYSFALHKYGIALYKGSDKNLYERQETIDVITRILSRNEKDNVLLVAQPGVGKTTVLSQFAKNVYRGLVPEKLKNRQVIEIPLADTPADALKEMFVEARSAGNIIAVLPEPEKYQNMFEEIIPLLGADELQVIAVTTFDGYVQSWKDNAEIMRYFEKVELSPLSDAATTELLRDFAHEHYPRVKVADGVIEEIVRRTNELIQNKTQPEKSIDLFEELAVGKREITIEAVDQMLSQRTGVPLGTIDRDEKDILLHLEDTLGAEIIGQKEAIHDISSALRRARTGVSSKGKPVGSFLFLGPTGTGKTYTAEMLARHYFGGDGVMVRFDMSEFALPESEARFAERLALAIEETPFSLLFLDELEKANRSVWNVLLQVLDEGRLTSVKGQTVSFKNNIIIATSNAGAVLIEEHPDTAKDALRQALIEQGIFTPEFLNRFDDVVLFHALTQNDAVAVTRLLLRSLNVRLQKDKGIQVAVTDPLVADLVQNGFDQKNGARALRRAVQEKVENAVADAILRDQAPAGTTLTIG